MKETVSEKASSENKQLALILSFFSSGVFCLPIIGIYLLFDNVFKRLSDSHEWLFYASILCSAVIVVAGMHTLERMMPRKLAGGLGLVCWAILYVVAWNYSASL